MHEYLFILLPSFHVKKSGKDLLKISSYSFLNPGDQNTWVKYIYLIFMLVAYFSRPYMLRQTFDCVCICRPYRSVKKCSPRTTNVFVAQMWQVRDAALRGILPNAVWRNCLLAALRNTPDATVATWVATSKCNYEHYNTFLLSPFTVQTFYRVTNWL